MKAKKYCLFCEDEVIKPKPASASSSSSPVGSNSETNNAIPSSIVPNLETLCHYLKIPDNVCHDKLKGSEGSENTGGDANNYYRLFKNIRPYFNGKRKVFSKIDGGTVICQHHPNLCATCFRKLNVLSKLFELLKETEERIEMRRNQLLNLILTSRGKHDRGKTQHEASSSLMEKKTDLESPELIQIFKCFVKKGLKEKKKASTATNKDPQPAEPAHERKVIKVVVYQQEQVPAFGHNNSSMIDENMDVDEPDGRDGDDFIDENDDVVDYDDNDRGAENDNLSNSEKSVDVAPKSTQETRRLPNQSHQGSLTATGPLQSSTFYTCRYCQKHFSTPLDYYNHRLTSHHSHFESLSNVSLILNSGKTISSWHCNLCGAQIISKNPLGIMDHMACHEAVDPLATDSSSPSSFFPKGEPAIPSPNPYQCVICKQKFKWKVNLDLHKICFHESTGIVQLTCDQCGNTTFNTREKLIRHLKEDHQSKKVYSCKNCPVSSSTLRKLMEHLKNDHADSARLQCPNPKCTVAFTSFVQLNQHCREKHVFNKSKLNECLKFPCGQCKRSFISKAGYDAHLKRCAANSKRPIEKRRKLLLPVAASSSPSFTPTFANHTNSLILCPPNQTYKCPVCGKGFTSRIILQQHMDKLHKKIRYQCDFCPKSYTSKSGWKNHRTVHTNVVEVTCSICSLVLSSKGCLKKHMRNQHSDCLKAPVPQPPEIGTKNELIHEDGQLNAVTTIE